MRFYTLRRAWTSMLVVGVPLALLTLVWAAFMGGRANAAALAFVYLLIAVAGRAQAIKREHVERPYREERVAHQLTRIRSTLPGAEKPAVQVDAPVAEPVAQPAAAPVTRVPVPVLRVVEPPVMADPASLRRFDEPDEDALVAERSQVESLTLRAV